MVLNNMDKYGILPVSSMMYKTSVTSVTYAVLRVVTNHWLEKTSVTSVKFAGSRALVLGGKKSHLLDT